jgi:hypothetical protein
LSFVITQGQARNLTGNLEVQVIGHGEQVDGINKLEGLNSDAVVEIIQRFIPQAAENNDFVSGVLFVLFGCYFLLHVVGSLIICYLDD